jgi:hypothetical protein
MRLNPVNWAERGGPSASGAPGQLVSGCTALGGGPPCSSLTSLATAIHVGDLPEGGYWDRMMQWVIMPA